MMSLLIFATLNVLLFSRNAYKKIFYFVFEWFYLEGCLVACGISRSV